MSLTSPQLAELGRIAAGPDRTAYYETLIRFGDPYGTLALSVCKQSLISGRVAKSYAEAVGTIWKRPRSTLPNGSG